MTLCALQRLIREWELIPMKRAAHGWHRVRAIVCGTGAALDETKANCIMDPLRAAARLYKDGHVRGVMLIDDNTLPRNHQPTPFSRLPLVTQRYVMVWSRATQDMC